MRRAIPLAVYALVALNVAVFIREFSAPDPDAFVDAFALIPYDVTHGVQLAAPSPAPLLTLVTSQFLHGSVPHIFFNMAFLLAFGPRVEQACGHVRFVALYLLCGICGGLAQISIAPSAHVPTVGASGAIAGVLGAYLVRFPQLPAAIFIALWAATQFLHGFGTVDSNVLSEQGGGVAYFAHIGGFLAGVILIGLFGTRPKAARRRRYRFRH